MSEKKSIEFRGSKLTYTKAGKGKPVLLIHGFAEDGWIFHNQLDYLKDKLLLLVPDLPGSGSSEFNGTYSSMEDYAEAIRQILEVEEIDSVSIIGHSMGGYITLAFVEKYSQLVSRYGLFHSSAFADDEQKIQTRRKGIRFIREHGSKAFLDQATPNLFSDITNRENPQLVQDVLNRYSNFQPEALVQYYEAMIIRKDRREVMKKSPAPVLLILGQYDNAIPIDKGLELARIPEICYIHICNNSGHMGMLEEKDLCNKALESFLIER